MPLKLGVIPYLDALTEEAQAVGSVNTTYFQEADGRTQHIGHNTDVLGLRNVILQSLKPDLPFEKLDSGLQFEKGKVAGFVIGAGGAARAAIYALHKLAVSPILLVNRDHQESLAVQKQFANLDVRMTGSLQELEKTLDDLRSAGSPCIAGIGCVPSEEPGSSAERLVYDSVELIFKRGQDAQGSANSDSGSHLPVKPYFLDMAYKPLMTRFRTLAEKYSWQSVSGAGIVEQICYEQAKLWTGRAVPPEGRQKVHNALQEHVDALKRAS